MEKEIIVLWKKTSKKGLDYLSGKNVETGESVVAYYNSDVNDDKKPYIKIYKSKPLEGNTTGNRF